MSIIIYVFSHTCGGAHRNCVLHKRTYPDSGDILIFPVVPPWCWHFGVLVKYLNNSTVNPFPAWSTDWYHQLGLKARTFISNQTVNMLYLPSRRQSHSWKFLLNQLQKSGKWRRKGLSGEKCTVFYDGAVSQWNYEALCCFPSIYTLPFTYMLTLVFHNTCYLLQHFPNPPQ